MDSDNGARPSSQGSRKSRSKQGPDHQDRGEQRQEAHGPESGQDGHGKNHGQSHGQSHGQGGHGQGEQGRSKQERGKQARGEQAQSGKGRGKKSPDEHKGARTPPPQGPEGRPQVRVRPAAHDDVGAIARTIARAFYDDPYNTWLFPDPSDRLERSARLYALEAGFDYVPQGLAEVAVADDRVVGAATWRGPGSRGTSPLALLRGAPHFIALFGPRRTAEILAAYQGIAAHGPSRPHWYLAELASDPAARGTGAGSALLRSGLARADADAVPVYLESSRKENLSFYERFGFAPTSEVDVPGLPPLYGMVREPDTGPGSVPVPGPRAGGSGR